MLKLSKQLLSILIFLTVVFVGLGIGKVSAASLTRAIVAGADDGYQLNELLSIFNSSNTYGLTGEDDPGNSTYSYNGWFRFTNITIPQGAIISNATLTLRTTTNTFGAGTNYSMLYGVAEDNHVAPTNTGTWQSDHALHTTGVAWNFTQIDAWDSVLTSPNFAAAIQPIINRAGWVSGNAIGIHWDENMADQDMSQGWVTWNSSTYIEPQLSITYTVPQCQDGSDNDGDGVTDLADPGCSGSSDNTENTATTQCQDGLDNDNDQATDLSDFSCSGATDNDETNPKAQCQDGVDNADPEDTLFDFGSDSGCSSKQDNDEGNTVQCNDGIDNADPEDSLIDYPADPGCSGTYDTSESNTVQCNDGIDNADPEDSLIDYPADPGCSGTYDNDEYNIPPGSSGWLISSTFDTGFSNGVKINAILWQGTLGGGSPNYVRFQIASSNCTNGASNAPTCSSGGWGIPVEGDGAFIGSDGTASTYYSPSDANVSYVIPTDQHNNKRYFRYKVELYRNAALSSPEVEDVVINWSP